MRRRRSSVARRCHHRGRALLAALALLAGSGSAAAQDADPPAVVVDGDDGLYTVAARFTVTPPPAVALAVLSDYETIPRIIPDVRRSVIVQRRPTLLVSQEAVSQFGLFSRTIHLLLEVTVGVDHIGFVDRSGRSFRQYHGEWRLQPHSDGTAITYALTARPSFKVPGFLIRRLLTRDATDMIDRLARAMVARAAP